MDATSGDERPAAHPPDWRNGTSADDVPLPRPAAEQTAPVTAHPPVPSPDGASPRWAICCSGGGIRSAAFCLGSIQRLEEGGLVRDADLILSVSGGSYLAASRALVAAGTVTRAAGEGTDRSGLWPPAYAPGTPEEQNLRDNTHYLVPDAKTVLVGVLSQLLGVVVTAVLVLAPLFAFAHAWGWLLRWRRVLCPPGPDGCAGGSPGGPWHTPMLTDWTWWSAAVALTVLTLILFLWWWATLAPRAGHSGHGKRAATAVGWAGLVTALVAVAMLAVPFLLAWLTRWHGQPAALASALGLGRQSQPVAVALAGLIPALSAIAHSALAKLRSWRLLEQGGKGKHAGRAARPGLLAPVTGWLRRVALPWLASVVIVVAVVIAGLIWVRDGAATAFSLAGLWPALIALGVMLGTRVIADVNRISMHDFYRWRLASAFAVQRGASAQQQSGTADGRDRPGARRAKRPGMTQMPWALLSDLQGQRPKLVICTTANINAEREVPVGRGGVSLTFDPDRVRLRGEGEVRSAEARTGDYETLVGRRRLTLFDIAAISGAAVSPLMGSMTRQAYRILFTMSNLRLGVWLPHPELVAAARAEIERQRERHARQEPGAAGSRGGGLDRWWHALGLLVWYMLPHPHWDDSALVPRNEARLWAYVLRLRGEGPGLGGTGSGDGPGSPAPARRGWLARAAGAVWYYALQPTAGLLWAEAVGHTSYRSTWICATDGGHYDNLGLVEALRLRAEHIVVLDASGDKAHTWFTLGEATALARSDAGVDVDLDPTTMVSPGGLADLSPGEVVRPWAKGVYRRRPEAGRRDGWRGRRGQAPDGQIWVCKLGWWQQAPWDVRAYAAAHPEYPGQSTLEQLYDGAEFDAYRVLGAAAVDAAMAAGGLPDRGGRRHQAVGG